jgi:NAD(P)H-flavin reductase
VPGDATFRPARLAGRESAGGGLTRVLVEPEAALLASYRTPGQYVEMRAGGETGFFVLSNEPGSPVWELVMRAGGGASDVVLAMPTGSAGPDIELTGAIGHGFPVESAAGHPLVVALNGTGVAAGPPLVRRRVRDGDALRTRVFVGVRVRDEVPIEDELERWRRQGVDVVLCLSQELQDVVRVRLSPGELAGGRVFAVGSSPMIDALRALAPHLGLDALRIHTNY